MLSKDNLNKIIHEYRGQLKAILGDDLDMIVLFGSQARGESVEGSDIDVLCIMKTPFQYGDLINRTSQATAKISLEHDVVISRTFVTSDTYSSSRSPFMMNVHKEQLAL
jgi:predicted nucleotidyltransferase